MPNLLYTNEKAFSGASVVGVQLEFSREFDFFFDDPSADMTDVAGALKSEWGVDVNSPYSMCGRVAYAQEFHPEQDTETLSHWSVSVPYRTLTMSAAEQDNAQQPNPLLRRPKVTGGWDAARVPVVSDRDGNPIVNSAGQIPATPAEVEGTMTTYVITHNVFPIPDWVWTYRSRYGVVNDSDFTLQTQGGQQIPIAKGCGRLHSVSFSDLKQDENQQYLYYELTFAITEKLPPPTDETQEGWVLDMVDQGKYQRKVALGAIPDNATNEEILAAINAQSVLVPCLDNNNEPVTEPVPLDGRGAQATKSGLSEPYIIYYDIAKAVDFTVLPACFASEGE